MVHCGHYLLKDFFEDLSVLDEKVPEEGAMRSIVV